MIASEELLLGLFMGTSAFLASLFLMSYRRSGLPALRLTGLGLTFHVVLTAILLYASTGTELFAGFDWWVVPLGDGLILLAVLLLGRFGGKAVEGSA